MTNLTRREKMENEEEAGRSARLAVEEVLLPSLKDFASILGRGLAAKCGTSDLYAATEAVSLLLRRYVSKRNLYGVFMRSNGDVVAYDNGVVVITASQLALEVARFTDLWEDNEVEDSELKVSVEAFAMVFWMREVLNQQPNLFRHFAASITNNPDRIFLTEISPENRVDDARQRWSRIK